MKDKLTKLIDVKTIITLSLLLSVIVLTLKKEIEPSPLVELLKMAVVFYFGVKAGEKK